MSETFLIKKTAFDDTQSGSIPYREANSFIIGPGELNGPTGVTKNSDLKLYGFGSARWGEGVNQNIYRLLENNSCPEKEDGDWHPTRMAYDYVATGSPRDDIMPKDERDLGIGNGITSPVIGQTWFNVTNDLSYTYTSSGWYTIVNDDGSLSLLGELDMGNNKIVNLAPPTVGSDAVNLTYTDANYVNIAGDTMTGALNMGSQAITNVPNPVNPQDAMTLNYSDANYVNIAGDTMTGALTVNNNLSVTGTTNFGNTPTVGASTIWHSGNDGAGSGLDADTIDGVDLSGILLQMYPVGSIYTSVYSTNPNLLFGGTWASFGEGRMLISQSGTYPAGSQGGSATHTLTINEMPAHNHGGGDHTHTGEIIETADWRNNSWDNKPFWEVKTKGAMGASGTIIDTEGGGAPHNNMPPYISVYMWQRTA